MGINAIVTRMAKGYQIPDISQSADPPRSNMMNVQFNVDMIVWPSTANSASTMITVEDLHPKLGSGSAAKGISFE